MLSIFFSLLLLFQEVTNVTSASGYDKLLFLSGEITLSYDKCVSFCQAALDSGKLINETGCTYTEGKKDRVFWECV